MAGFSGGFSGEVAPDLIALARDGQDKDAIDVLYRFLADDLEPENVVEKMLLRDLAMLTVRGAEVRLIELAVHKLVMAQNKGAAMPVPSSTKDGVAQDEAFDRPDAKGRLAPAIELNAAACERLLALTYVQHLALFDSLIKLGSHLRAERMRVLKQFDDRRKQSIQKTLDEMLDVLG